MHARNAWWELMAVITIERLMSLMAVLHLFLVAVCDADLEQMAPVTLLLLYSNMQIKTPG